MERKITIYTLDHPITGEVRYVGKTENLVERLRGHLNTQGTSHQDNWIRSLKKIGLYPKIEILEIVNEPDWQEAERFWIETLRQMGVRLTNADAGGRGLGGKRSLEVRQKISLKHKGKVLTEEHKAKLRVFHQNRKPEVNAKISATLTGKKLSEETKLKMSKACKGRKMSDEFKAKLKLAWSSPEKRKQRSELVTKIWAERNALKQFNEQN